MLKAGFSRLDVTPPLKSYMSGYFFARYAEGIDDPIYLNAVAVGDGENTVVMIAADVLMITKVYCDEIRKLISEKTSIDKDNIMICCLHQHTSIAIRNIGDSASNEITRDREYLDFLYRKFSDVAKMAIDDMKEANISVAIEETAEKISFIRRYIMKNGKIETNPNDRYLEVERPYCEADNNVRIVKFERKEGNDIALINFSTHADVIHTSRFSADWCGFARKFVEKDLKDVSCILTVGVQGDSNHADFTIPQYKDGYEHSKHMGRVIADAVVKVWDKTEPIKADKINCAIETVYNRTRTDGEEKYEEALAILEDEKKNPDTTGSRITELGNAARIVRLRNASIYNKIPVTVINMGKIGFVGFGGEPFTQYADGVRKNCPDRFIIASCCTNGGEGYLPTKKAFEEGGYESSSSQFSPDLEESCVALAAKLLKALAE